MEEGVLAKWLVKEGDAIKQGTMLCSVETDKTTVDYESMDEGYIRKIILPEGSQAKVNDLIAILTDEKDEDYQAYLEKALAKQGAGASKPAAQNSPAASAASSAPTAPAQTAAPAAQATSPAASMAHSNGGRIKVSPLAKKMATEKGIPLDSLDGTGPSGRIIKRDIDAYRPASATAATAGAVATSTAGKGDAVVSRPIFGSLAPIAPTADHPLNMMRKTIGKRLLESTQGIPVFYVTMKINMGPINTLRAQLNRAPGYKVSVNDIVVKTCSAALRQFPGVNSSYHGDFIRQHAEIDICVAVSIDGGLITPIVKGVDTKGLGQVSSEIKELVKKAKSGKLKPEEYQGGTFTVSNMGMYGVDAFTSIINPPQAAILAVGAIQNELALDESGKVFEKEIMKVTLSADHRVVDGALAAQFLSGLKSLMENPVWLLL
jgi:pyruvate dehydrogenase E2 component (dihydrolipoamide acetyltransferase)